MGRGFGPVSDVVSLLGGLGGGGVGGSLEFVHVQPPLGDLGEGFFAGVAVADEPAPDDGARAPDSGPAVNVDGLAVGDGGVYGVQGGGHELWAVGDAEVAYGVAFMRDGEAEGSGFFPGDFIVGWELVRGGEVDEVVDARLEEPADSQPSAGGVEVAGVFTRGEGTGDNPVGVGGGGFWGIGGRHWSGVTRT